MKRNKTLHVVLAGIGCASLLVYILACTSFSPDDSQVLYPAFDKQSGDISIAVYNRETGKSENLFTAMAPGTANRDLLLTRAQWLPDGKHVLIGHVPPDGGKELSLLVVPRGVNEPIRHLLIPNLDEPASALEFPFCVRGSTVFLCDEKTIRRVDFLTGQSLSTENTNQVWALPGNGKTIVAAGETKNGHAMVFGVIDPQTLAFKPELTLTNDFSDGVFPTFDLNQRRAVFVTGEETHLQLQVTKGEQVQFSRRIERGGAKVTVGPWLDPGPRQDRVFTLYMSQAEGAKDAEYGCLEIPLNHDPLRWIPLFRAKPADEGDLVLAQASLSHDGQTWALATTYLYVQNKSLKPENCALYLVEVGQAKPKITKVPIPVPEERRQLGIK